MRLLLVSMLAACSFQHGSVSGGSADTDPPPVSDAPVAPPIDAAAQPTIDAYVCPDDDGDGLCDTDDDWPCGARPTEPPATVMFSINSGQSEVTVTNGDLHQSGRLATASPGQSVMLRFDFTITDTACANACIDQLEIGWVQGGRVACVFDDPVPRVGGVSGSIDTTIQAPSSPMVYDLRVNLGQNYSCNYNGASGWWGGTPPSTRTIAKLCVH